MNTHRLHSRIFHGASRVLVGVIVLSWCICSQGQASSSPRLIRFSSSLGPPQNTTAPYVTGVTFSVYGCRDCTDAIWSETQALEISPDGRFEALLGASSKEGIPVEIFRADEERWLGVRPDGGAEHPRVLLVSVPYALHAADSESLGGRPASAYMLQSSPATTAITQSEVSSAEVAREQTSGTVSTGSPNYLAKFIDAATIATSNVVETALGIGVDVSAPTQKFDVYGRIKLRARDTASSGFWLTDSNGGQQLFVGQTALQSSSPFGIWHGNAWRFALTSAGDLGVGVGITPTARLDLGGRAVIRSSDQGSAGIWLTGSSGSRSLFLGQTGLYSSDAFGIWHGGAWRFILDAAGNVGIGGTPQFPLDVRGRMILRGSTTQPSGIWFSGPADTPQLFAGQTSSSATAPFGILHGNDWRFILLPNGNIGIGTDAPTEKLEVSGNLKLGANGRLVFPDGSSVSSATSLSTNLKPQDSSLQVTNVGSEIQLSVAQSGITTSKLADGSVTSTKIADGSISGAKLVDGSVSASKLAPGGLPASTIAGTAAVLGTNSFNGNQNVQGGVNVSGALQVSGMSQLSTTIATVSGSDQLAVDASNYGTTGNSNAIRATTYSVNGSALYAVAQPTSGNAVAVFGRTSAPQGSAIYGEASSDTGANFAFRGISRSGTGTGVQGEALGTTGANFGVVGRASGDYYSAGVLAEATASSTAWNTYGLLARNSSKNGIGVFGLASSLTGNTYGVYGRVDSPSGVAGMFMTSSTSGNVLVANNGVKRIFRLDASGNLFAAGTLNPNGADYAESVAVSGDRQNYEPGDVLVIDREADRQLTLSSEPYATNVAGVYSTKPGLLGSQHEMGANPENEIPVAMVGIVPCKVTADNGPIRRGDLLVTSSIPGYAMRGTDRARMLGAVLGKALQELEAGSGIIEVMVSAQ